jgi:hypothetical protein
MPFDFAGTLTRQGRDNWSTHKVLLGILTGPDSYATGGEAFAPASVGWNSFDLVLVGVATDGTNTALVVWDAVNAKLMWFVPSTNVEVANAVDLSTVTAYLFVAGHG